MTVRAEPALPIRDPPKQARTGHTDPFLPRLAEPGRDATSRSPAGPAVPNHDQTHASPPGRPRLSQPATTRTSLPQPSRDWPFNAGHDPHGIAPTYRDRTLQAGPAQTSRTGHSLDQKRTAPPAKTCTDRHCPNMLRPAITRLAGQAIPQHAIRALPGRATTGLA